MRIGLVCAALLVSAFTGWGQSAKETKAETIARWHFAGTKQLSGKKELSVLREIIALPATRDLRDLALATFSAHVAQRFTRSADTNENSRVAALIKPLLPDVLENESRFELIARGVEDADWLLALQLPSERMAEWNKNLTDLAQAARMQVSNGKNGAW